MSRSERIDEVAQRYTIAEKFSGIEWLVESRGEVLALGKAGFADFEAQTAIPEMTMPTCSTRQ